MIKYISFHCPVFQPLRTFVQERTSQPQQSQVFFLHDFMYFNCLVPLELSSVLSSSITDQIFQNQRILSTNWQSHSDGRPDLPYMMNHVWYISGWCQIWSGGSLPWIHYSGFSLQTRFLKHFSHIWVADRATVFYFVIFIFSCSKFTSSV